jgi:hypothetical protein
LSETARQSGSGFFFEVFLAARYVVFWERIAGGSSWCHGGFFVG